MAKASAVIGANYGDEGKGQIVDLLCRRDTPPIVVRYNGGSQAGHTVELVDGSRHVFSHFGSGTLAGAETHLSQFFVVNPITFKAEHNVLLGFKQPLMVSVHPAAVVTTPIDMAINQQLSKSKNNSCGKGIFETIRRQNEGYYPLTVGLMQRLISLDVFEKYLRSMFDHRWALFCVENKRLGESFPFFSVDDVIERFVEDCISFLSIVWIMSNPVVGKRRVIFEGAQGLKLCQSNHEDFPHLTPSYTGVHNINMLLEQFDVSEIDLHYVTRTYLTRHGAGPLPNEDPSLADVVPTDKTNFNNPYQGPLRYAPLDVDELAYRVLADARKCMVRRTVFIDSMHANVDQVPMINFENKVEILSGERVAEEVKRSVSVHALDYNIADVQSLISKGKTAWDVQLLE